MKTLPQILDTFTPSKLELVERCPEAFFQRYVLGRRRPPGAAQAFGNAFDACANNVYAAKLRTRETDSANEVRDLFADWWAIESRKVEEWGPEEHPGKMLDTGAAGVVTWRDRIAVYVQPLREPQVPIEFEVTSARQDLDEACGIAPKWRVFGKVDLLASVDSPGLKVAATCIDQKASRRTYGEAEVLRSAQPAMYCRGLNVPLFQFHNMRTDLVTPKVQVVRTVVSEGAVEHVLHRMEIARRTIARAYASGDWTPNRNHQLCSRRWCGFAAECESRHGGRVVS